MKISNLVEEIFAQAVALDQSGGLRNTIYAVDKEIYIMNYDHSLIMQFRLRDSEITFDHPISFKANDYDSNEFEEKDGRIIFHSEKDGYERKKICGTTDISPQDVKGLFRKYLRQVVSSHTEWQSSILSKSVLELLDDDLSHIEFSGQAGESVKLLQRNIYSGSIIEITKSGKGFFKDVLTYDFGPVAMKTDDFRALFNFQDSLKFVFPTKDEQDYFVVKSTDKFKRDMSAFVACCLYDELIKINEVKIKENKSIRTK